MMLHNAIRRLATGLAIALTTLALVPGLVLAHAELEEPSPADKSTVTVPVTEVSGLYSEGMKRDGSSLVVKDASGTVVAEGTIDPFDDERMFATPDTPLTSGKYRVEWTSQSAEDGDIARGVWTFTVAVAPTPSASPTPAPTATPAASAAVTPAPTPVPATPVPTVAASPSPSGDGTATGSGGDAVLPIIVALIALGAGAAYLLTRRNRPTEGA